jgi:hypothetical protein
LDLCVPLAQVLLIDTDRIRPKNPQAIWTSKHSKSIDEVSSDNDFLVVASHYSSVIWVSPSVR